VSDNIAVMFVLLDQMFLYFNNCATFIFAHSFSVKLVCIVIGKVKQYILV